MLKDTLASSCIDGVYIDSVGKLVLDCSKLKHLMLDIKRSLFGVDYISDLGVTLAGQISSDCSLYNIGKLHKVLKLGNTLYEFSTKDGIYDSISFDLIKDLIGLVNNYGIGANGVLELLSLLVIDLGNKGGNGYKVKYLDNGGYAVHILSKYVVIIGKDGSYLGGYTVLRNRELEVKILGEVVYTRCYFIGEYNGDLGTVAFASNSDLNLLGYTGLEDVDNGGLKLLEYTGINRCRLIDILDCGVNLEQDSVVTVYNKAMDLCNSKNGIRVCYKGRFIDIARCQLGNILEDRVKFIDWYNGKVKDGLDYSEINSLLNLSYYNLEVITNTETKDISLSLVELLNVLIGNKKEFYRLNVGVNGMLL